MAKQPLHDLLCGLLPGLFPEEEGDHCYYQPPADIQMYYPCFVYHYSNDLDTFADNLHYRHSKRYTVTYITEDPDDNISEKMRTIPYCTSDRNFSVSGLSHFVFTLYYNGPRIKEECRNGTSYQMGPDRREKV